MFHIPMRYEIDNSAQQTLEFPGTTLASHCHWLHKAGRPGTVVGFNMAG